MDFLELSVTHPTLGNKVTLKPLLTNPSAVLDRLVKAKFKQHGGITDKVPDSRLLVVGVMSLGGRTRPARRYVKEVIKNRPYSSNLFQREHQHNILEE